MSEKGEWLEEEHHKNGQLAVQCSYRGDKLHGSWNLWHDNGQLKNEATFRNGQKVEIEKWYSYSGELLAEMHFLDGNMNGTTICEVADEETFEAKTGIMTYKNGIYLNFEPFKELPKGYDTEFD
jgi:antitoxin component YwqK of YwqJK toxin-antitoxin module